MVNIRGCEQGLFSWVWTTLRFAGANQLKVWWCEQDGSATPMHKLTLPNFDHHRKDFSCRTRRHFCPELFLRLWSGWFRRSLLQMLDICAGAWLFQCECYCTSQSNPVKHWRFCTGYIWIPELYYLVSRCSLSPKLLRCHIQTGLGSCHLNIGTFNNKKPWIHQTSPGFRSHYTVTFQFLRITAFPE